MRQGQQYLPPSLISKVFSSFLLLAKRNYAQQPRFTRLFLRQTRVRSFYRDLWFSTQICVPRVCADRVAGALYTKLLPAAEMERFPSPPSLILGFKTCLIKPRIIFRG